MLSVSKDSLNRGWFSLEIDIGVVLAVVSVCCRFSVLRLIWRLWIGEGETLGF
jgi:hypothetical protein